MRIKLFAGGLALALIAPGFAAADPWKDESGHGRWGSRAERWDDREWDRRDWRRGQPRHARQGIPPGHRPPPGYCRDWIPAVPPGHQPPPFPC